VYKPNCDFKELKNGCWRAVGGMQGWASQPDLLNIPYVHLALTLQSTIAAQQPSQRHMARQESRKALLFILRKQAQVPVQCGTYKCSTDAKTPSGSRGRSEKPEPDCCPVQPYQHLTQKGTNNT
jgi:hypothetical protein